MEHTKKWIASAALPLLLALAGGGCVNNSVAYYGPQDDDAADDDTEGDDDSAGDDDVGDDDAGS